MQPHKQQIKPRDHPMSDNCNIDNPNHATDVNQDKKRKGCFSCRGCVVIALLLMILLFRFLLDARETARLLQCVNHQKQLGLVLHNYYDIHKTYPPAYTTDAEGKPLHSWRVLILPFMYKQCLYDEIRLDEPWDSEHNSQFHDQMPELYYCPCRPADEKTTGLTSYQMVIGPDTISNGPNCTKFSDVTRDRSDTLLLVEASVPVCWMKPEDLPQSTLMNGVVSSVPRRGKPVVQGVGSPHFSQAYPFAKKIPKATAITVSGLEQVFSNRDTSPEELLEKSRIRNPE